MSFPPGTEMFQFPGFALIPLWIQGISPFLISVGPKTAPSPLPLIAERKKPARKPPRRSRCGHASKRRRASSEQQRSKGGFPIRRFTDQSLFAAPHDLSQRTTSFIASQRQGIHRIPLRHLIALIARPRSRAADPGGQTSEDGKPRLPSSVVRLPSSESGVEKTSFASNASGDLSGQAPNPRLVARKDDQSQSALSPSMLSRTFQAALRNNRPSTECASSSQCQISPDGKPGREPFARAGLPAAKRPDAPRAAQGEPDKLHRDRIIEAARRLFSKWWSQTGSNRRPHACKARALPTELWPRKP